MALDWNKGVEVGIGLAKAQMRLKVSFWNLVRIVMIIPFAVIILLMILSWRAYGYYPATGAWIIISLFVIIRNIRKCGKETRRISGILDEDPDEDAKR